MAPFYKDTTVQDLDKLLSMSRGARSRFEPSWHLNLAYYYGEQWLFWNRGRLDRPRLDPHRVTLTDNRMMGIIQSEIARMTKQKPAFSVTPTSAEDSDVQASETGEKILDYLWMHMHIRDKLTSVLRWSRITGAGFWKIVWDSAKGQKMQIVVDPEGKPVMHGETGAPMKPEHFEGPVPDGLKEQTIATGDVHLETISPFEIFQDPIPSEFTDVEWIIQMNVKSPEYVKMRYNVELDPDTDIAPGPTEARMFPSYMMGASSGYKGIQLKEYWCRPNSIHPEGRRAVWAKGKMLYEGPNPYKKLPFIMFRGMPVPGRFWPSSLAEQLRGPQTELNKIRSQIVENAQRIGNPALLCARQAATNYSGIPGERIDFDDTVPNAIPSYLQPPQMPQYVLQQQDRIEQSMQEISGQHEVSNAQVPAGVKAASAINLLQEADDTRLGPAIYDMEEALGYAGTMLLKLVAQYWTDERIIMIAGEDHFWDSKQFKGAALKGNTRVEVQAGSAFPRSKAAKQAAMQDVLNLFLQYTGQPINPRDMRKFLKDYEAGGLERLFGQMSGSEAQVNRENQQIAQSEPIPINTYDEHQVHVDGHTEFQRGPTYKLLGPEVEQIMEAHVMEHRQQLMAEQEPVVLPQPQPNGGGPQGAPQPTSSPSGGER